MTRALGRGQDGACDAHSGPSGVADSYSAVIDGWYPKSSLYSLNARNHWAARKRLTDDAHERVGWALRDAVGRNRWPCGWPMVGSPECGRWTITLTVVQRKGRCPDGDNLQGALKGVRDAVAKDLTIDDGSPNVEWRYCWVRGADGVLIELVEVVNGRDAPSA